jgi:hypothetical protein
MIVVEADRRRVRLGVAIKNKVDPCPVNCAEAHGTRLATGVNLATGQAMSAKFAASCPNGDHFGVGGRIVGAGDLVRPFADDASVMNDDGAKRAAAAGGDIRLGEGDRPPHKTIPIHDCLTFLALRLVGEGPYHVGVGGKYHGKDKHVLVRKGSPLREYQCTLILRC